MSYIEIFLLALALSVDACAVSFTYGLNICHKRFFNALLLACFTGFFQGAMPVGGYFLTTLVKTYIEPYAKFVIFVIFIYLGIRFIRESFQKEKEKMLCIGLACLLLIGVATSIDAFSAGISLALYGNKILKPSLLIALVTFINSSLGFWLGCKLKNLPSKALEISAGVVLMLLGIKALF